MHSTTMQYANVEQVNLTHIDQMRKFVEYEQYIENGKWKPFSLDITLSYL